MPWNRSLYPPAPVWNAVRAAVLARAENRCEATMPDRTRCNAPNGELIVRPFKDSERWQSWKPYSFEQDATELGGRLVKVVLTSAHLCQCEPICAEPTHLSSECQWHHLHRDSGQHARTAAETRRQKRIASGQGALELAI